MEFFRSLFFNEEDNSPNWPRIGAAAAALITVLLLGVTVVYAMQGAQREPEPVQAIVQTPSPATTATAASATLDLEGGWRAASPTPTIDTAALTAIAATEIADLTAVAQLAQQPTATPSLPPTSPPEATPLPPTPTTAAPTIAEPTPTTPDADTGEKPTVVLPTATPTPQPSATPQATNRPANAATKETDTNQNTPVPTSTPRPTAESERVTSAEEEIRQALTATATRTPTAEPDGTPSATATRRPTVTPGTDAPPAQPVNVDFSPFGIEVNRGAVGQVDTYMQELYTEGNVSWVRFNGIVWPEIEPAEGQRSWSNTDAALQKLIQANQTPMVIVRGTPEWAQQDWQGAPPPGAGCSPIRQEKLPAFADFLRAAVERYSQPPYNIRYWELGNEPDVDPELVSDDLGFGCWGDSDDASYGGGYYAEMLHVAYPAIKEADPDAVVVLGGLLLDCDPTNPPADKDCSPGTFLEGVLNNGGSRSFDVVAYHGYAYWLASEQDSDRNSPAWQHRGGALLGKLDFLEEVLAQYNTEKPIIANEIGLLCYPNTPCDPTQNNQEAQQQFLEAQAGYVMRGYTRAWGNGLTSAAWYTLDDPDWRQAGLLEGDDQPRPGYQTLLFLSRLLEGARFVEQAGDGGALEGYAFEKDSTRYTVYWTNDGSAVEVALPPGARTRYDKLGQESPITGATITVGFDPVIIESQP